MPPTHSYTFVLVSIDEGSQVAEDSKSSSEADTKLKDLLNVSCSLSHSSLCPCCEYDYIHHKS